MSHAARRGTHIFEILWRECLRFPFVAGISLCKPCIVLQTLQWEAAHVTTYETDLETTVMPKIRVDGFTSRDLVLQHPFTAQAQEHRDNFIIHQKQGICKYGEHKRKQHCLGRLLLQYFLLTMA